ncbi:hypothetical protein GPECTOR_9g547 [Gonium pectorale]|uniref:Uncharacterized protein n=1 Tax=Gonium pectorale TaxID=33097 RepID=A0A150GRT9_GONPE|nr:hypothetical protein GPECTOR_9g547 [Gonium pectorale]|eukprot:KXZ52503.1 hypothetical protein GPECTOR_9g547 [Gonium pectorale]
MREDITLTEEEAAAYRKDFIVEVEDSVSGRAEGVACGVVVKKDLVATYGHGSHVNWPKGHSVKVWSRASGQRRELQGTVVYQAYDGVMEDVALIQLSEAYVYGDSEVALGDPGAGVFTKEGELLGMYIGNSPSRKLAAFMPATTLWWLLEPKVPLYDVDPRD